MTPWQGSRGTKCPKCRGSVCSERDEERCCELCAHAWLVQKRPPPAPFDAQGHDWRHVGAADFVCSDCKQVLTPSVGACPCPHASTAPLASSASACCWVYTPTSATCTTCHRAQTPANRHAACPGAGAHPAKDAVQTALDMYHQMVKGYRTSGPP